MARWALTVRRDLFLATSCVGCQRLRLALIQDRDRFVGNRMEREHSNTLDQGAPLEHLIVHASMTGDIGGDWGQGAAARRLLGSRLPQKYPCDAVDGTERSS